MAEVNRGGVRDKANPPDTYPSRVLRKSVRKQCPKIRLGIRV